MRAAVIDDERFERETLLDYMARFSAESGNDIEVNQYSSGDALLQDYREMYDLLIFDIEMPGISGIEAARRVREIDGSVVILFVTNAAQYAISAFDVEAVDYVLKPVAYQDFSLKLRKAIRYIRRNRDEKITLHTTDGIARLSVKKIVYVESMLHYLTYHTQDGDYRVRQTMGEAEETLSSFQFARCAKSFLVNLHHVRAIEKSDVIVDSARLKISRGRQAAFLDRFAQFLGGVDA